MNCLGLSGDIKTVTLMNMGGIKGMFEHLSYNMYEGFYLDYVISELVENKVIEKSKKAWHQSIYVKVKEKLVFV